MNNTVAVLGPGAVGGSLAVRLANADVHVVCVAHSEAAGLIALAGLVVESQEGTSTARVEVVEHLAKPVELLLVTVKAPALDDAIERVDPSAVSAGVVLPLLNGLGHMEVLRARFGDRVAAGSISHFQAYRPGRVQIIEATPSPVITLASETLPRWEVERAADMLRRGHMDIRVGENEKRVLWHKLARIAPLAAVTSVTGRTVGELRGDPPWRAKLEGAINETCAVAEADGVSLRPAAQWSIIDLMADETTTSAARDVIAGRRSELDAIVGGVLRTADRLDVPCPTLTGLAQALGLR
jgi:2-dehydropantoate 2-reductase